MSQQSKGVPFKLFDIWRRYRWLLVAAATVVVIGLGYYGFGEYDDQCNSCTRTDCDDTYLRLSRLDRLYLTLQLFTLESIPVPMHGIPELEIARLLAPALFAYATIEALLALFDDQVRLFRLQYLRNHIVICGYSVKGRLLTRALRNTGETVVVIDHTDGNELTVHCRKDRTIRLAGDLQEDELLQLARLPYARELYCVLEEEGVNARVAIRSRELARQRRGGRLDCYLHVTDANLIHWLHELEFTRSPCFRLILFNVNEAGARSLLNEHPPFPGPLLLVGFGSTGENVLLEIAKYWASFRAEPHPLAVTVIDPRATESLAAISRQYTSLTELCTIETIPCQFRSPDFLAGTYLFNDAGKCRFRCVYVCLDDDLESLNAAFVLRSHLHPLGVSVVVVQSSEENTLATLLGVEAFVPSGGLHVFPMLERACQPEELRRNILERLARMIHDDYVENRRREGQSAATNPSIVPWEELPESLRDSSRQQALDIGNKLDAIGCRIVPSLGWQVKAFTFTQDETELLSRSEHSRWVEERAAAGWTGGEKSEERKTSPYLVDWQDLPETIRDYDREAVRHIPILLAKAGFEIRRKSSTAIPGWVDS